jgi:hypothetical protein
MPDPIGGALTGAAAGSPGGPIGAAVGAIVGFIAGLFSFGKDSVGALSSALTKLAGWSANAVRSIRDVLSAVTGKGIWESIKRIGRALDQARKRLAGWISPLMDWLRRARDWLDFIYHRVIRPILNMIQRIRQMLVALRILHVKWAEKLDRVLLQVEKSIIVPFEAVRRGLNDVITILQEVLSHDGLLRGGVFLGSADRFARDLRRILHAVGIRALDDADTKRLAYWNSYTSDAAIAARIARYANYQPDEEEQLIVRLYHQYMEEQARG